MGERDRATSTKGPQAGTRAAAVRTQTCGAQSTNWANRGPSSRFQWMDICLTPRSQIRAHHRAVFRTSLKGSYWKGSYWNSLTTLPYCLFSKARSQITWYGQWGQRRSESEFLWLRRLSVSLWLWNFVTTQKSNREADILDANASKIKELIIDFRQNSNQPRASVRHGEAIQIVDTEVFCKQIVVVMAHR